MKKGLLIVFMLMGYTAFAQPPVDTTVHTVADEMPQFKGGEDALKKFIKDSLRYPLLALEAYTRGTINVSFIVHEDGSLKGTGISSKTMAGPGAKDCANEALRLVSIMPKWVPGKMAGKAVKVLYILPFVFDSISPEKEISDELISIPISKTGCYFPVDTTVYTVVEVMPQYPGGDDALLKFLSKNMKINATDKCLPDGKLQFSFIIEKDGKLSHLQCNNKCNSDEFLAPFKTMPAWTPGKQNGKAVRVKFTVPVTICIR